MKERKSKIAWANSPGDINDGMKDGIKDGMKDDIKDGRRLCILYYTKCRGTLLKGLHGHAQHGYLIK